MNHIIEQLNLRNYVNEADAHTIAQFILDTQNGIIRHNEMLLFYGDGGNGKTTLLNNIINYLGANNCLKIASSHNYRANLENKKMVICDEVSSDMQGMLKSLLCDNRFYHNSHSFGRSWNIIACTSDMNMFMDDIALNRRIFRIQFAHHF